MGIKVQIMRFVILHVLKQQSVSLRLRFKSKFVDLILFQIYLHQKQSSISLRIRFKTKFVDLCLFQILLEENVEIVEDCGQTNNVDETFECIDQDYEKISNNFQDSVLQSVNIEELNFEGLNIVEVLQFTCRVLLCSL